MIEVWITDAAMITALGCSLGSQWEGLMTSRVAIGPMDRLPVTHNTCKVAASIDGLEVPEGTSRLAPLLDRLLSLTSDLPQDSLLFTATTKGPIDLLEAAPDTCRENTLSVLETIRNVKGLQDYGVNFNAACASSTVAIAHGASLITRGKADVVFVVCFDIVSTFVFSGFDSLQALDTSPCRPFDSKRSGLSLGEAGAALTLMSARRAKGEGRRKLGTIMGSAVTNDASHITAPDREGRGLKEAISLSMSRADIEPTSVAAICAHGTGTIFNDAMEMVVYKDLFGSTGVPLFSVKGSIGHTLGAAGGVETIISLMSLLESEIPPTAGLGNAEEGFDAIVRNESVPIEGSCMVTTNSGFGGVNAALVLGRGDSLN